MANRKTEDEEFKKLEAAALALIKSYDNNAFKVKDIKVLRGIVEKMLILKPKCRIIAGDRSIALSDFLIALKKEEIILDALVNEANELGKKLRKKSMKNGEVERLYYLLNEIKSRSPSEYKANKFDNLMRKLDSYAR